MAIGKWQRRKTFLTRVLRAISSHLLSLPICPFSAFELDRQCQHCDYKHNDNYDGITDAAIISVSFCHDWADYWNKGISPKSQGYQQQKKPRSSETAACHRSASVGSKVLLPSDGSGA